MHYNYIIIGAGAAGLHLALAMLENGFLKNKTVLILEKEEKVASDKTWCFWESGQGRWDSILHHSWDMGKFISPAAEVELNLAPYRYKMLQSGAFYKYAKEKINGTAGMSWKKGTVTQVQNDGSNECVLLENGEEFFAPLVFDSRIDPKFFDESDPYFRVWQHFKGWTIQTKEDIFDPFTFTMMDFRIQHKDSTSFTYVLPTGPNQALIEFTLFSPELLNEGEYDQGLKKYISEILNLPEYEILEEEKGVIPMTDYPFHQVSTGSHIKIGTAGSWVKPSSGYSFRNAEHKAHRIIENLRLGKPATSGLLKYRHRVYDTLFLDRLFRDNANGEALFSTMYTKNDIQQIFRFLDEDTTFTEELQIMSTFKPLPFMGAIVRWLGRR
jgi:lycopene beta-cyclase